MGRLDVLVGGLSKPSKMPGFAYGLPAKACIIGAILRKKIGSVCSKCYALKGMYVFPCVQKAQYRRLAIVQFDVREWANGMAKIIHFKCPARQQNNNCQDCRACWDKSVKTVDYPLH